MSVDVEVSQRIERPVEEVAAYASEPDNAPTWYRRISSATWLTEPPLVEGSRFAFEAAFLGRRLSYTYEITHLEPGRSLTMATTEGPFPMATTYIWTATDDGATVMTLRNHGEPSGFSRVVAPVVPLAMRRAMVGDLRQLRDILETA